MNSCFSISVNWILSVKLIRKESTISSIISLSLHLLIDDLEHVSQCRDWFGDRFHEPIRNQETPVSPTSSTLCAQLGLGVKSSISVRGFLTTLITDLQCLIHGVNKSPRFHNSLKSSIPHRLFNHLLPVRMKLFEVYLLQNSNSLIRESQCILLPS